MTKNTLKNYFIGEQITLIKENFNYSITENIKNIYDKCLKERQSFVQQISNQIYLLSIYNKDIEKIKIKKISDKLQYHTLPSIENDSTFIKVPFSSLKINSDLASIKNKDILMIFYVNKNHLFNEITKNIKNINFEIDYDNIIIFKEIKHTIKINDIIIDTIYKNITLKERCLFETNNIENNANFYQQIYDALKKVFNNITWSIQNFDIYYDDNEISKKIEHQKLAYEIKNLGFTNNIEKYLSSLTLTDLDLHPWFPTLTVRSLSYTKARPNALFIKEEGFSICATKEYLGKQAFIKNYLNNNDKLLLWQKRAELYLCQNTYKAKAIFHRNAKNNSVALIGEKISSIVLYPALIKKALEKLNLDFQDVKLVSENEDTLVIVNTQTPWAEITDLQEQVSDITQMIYQDGADGIILYKELKLPDVGFGNFSFDKIHPLCFNLLDAAKRLNNNQPNSHRHYLLGLAYECLNERSLALLEFKKAFMLDSNDLDILSALGNAFLESGNLNDAFTLLYKAYNLSDNNHELAHKVGEVSFTLGKIDICIQAFEKALSIQPACCEYLINLSKAYLVVKRTQEALDLLHKAIKFDPESAYAHQTLAIIYEQEGQSVLAKKHALLAYDANPIDNDITNLLWELTQNNKK